MMTTLTPTDRTDLDLCTSPDCGTCKARAEAVERIVRRHVVGVFDDQLAAENDDVSGPGHAVEFDAPPEWWRVTFTHGSLNKVNRARRRFRCDGHIAHVRHFIEPGERYVRTSLPPNHSEINNDGWWRMRFCMACCPVEWTRATPPGSDTAS